MKKISKTVIIRKKVIFYLFFIFIMGLDKYKKSFNSVHHKEPEEFINKSREKCQFCKAF
jgi:hypothetical protein